MAERKGRALDAGHRCLCGIANGYAPSGDGHLYRDIYTRSPNRNADYAGVPGPVTHEGSPEYKGQTNSSADRADTAACGPSCSDSAEASANKSWAATGATDSTTIF